MVWLLPYVLVALGVGFLIANVRAVCRHHPLSAAEEERAADLAGASAALLGLVLFLGVALGVLHSGEAVRAASAPRRRVRRGDDVRLLRLRRAADAAYRDAGSTPTGSGRNTASSRTTRSAASPGAKGSRSRCCWCRASSSWPGPLIVPERHYGAVRRLLRDKIGAHDIMFAGESLDLGGHDEREDV